jgi:hypothetical protein
MTANRILMGVAIVGIALMVAPAANAVLESAVVTGSQSCGGTTCSTSVNGSHRGVTLDQGLLYWDFVVKDSCVIPNTTETLGLIQCTTHWGATTSYTGAICNHKVEATTSGPLGFASSGVSCWL